MFDAFTIAVRMQFASNAAGVLGGLLRDLGHVNGAVGALQKRFKELAPLAVSALSVFVGVKIEKGIWDIVKASQGFTQQLELMKQIGPEVAGRMGEIKTAMVGVTLKTPTVTAEEATRLTRELIPQLSAGGVNAGIDEALQLAPFAAKYSHVLAPFSKGADPFFTALRIAENRGGTTSKGPDGKMHFDIAKLLREVDAISAAVRLQSGAVSLGQLQTAMQQAGESMRAMDPMVAYPMIAEEIVAMGTKAGFAHQGMTAQFIGGVMPLRVADALTKEGLLKRDEWKSARGGRVILNKSASTRWMDELKDPRAFADRMMAKFEKDDKSLGELIQFLTRILGRQNVQRLWSDWQANKPTFDRLQVMAKGVPGTEATFKELEGNNLTTNITEVSSSWKTFTEVLGSEDTGIAITVLQKLREGIQFFTREVGAHPDIASGLLTLVGALGALMVIGGALGVLAFAMAPLGGLATLGTAAAIAAFGTAIYTVLKLVNWGDVRAWAYRIREWATGVTSTVVGWLGRMWEGMLVAAVSVGAVVAQIVASFKQDMLKIWTALTEALLGFVQRLRQFVASIASIASGTLGALKQGAQQEMVPGMPGSGLGPRVPVPNNGFGLAPPGITPGSLHQEGGRGQHPVPIMNAIYLDGREIARVVTHHQAKAATRPHSSTNRVDYRMSPAWASVPVPV